MTCQKIHKIHRLQDLFSKDLLTFGRDGYCYCYACCKKNFQVIICYCLLYGKKEHDFSLIYVILKCVQSLPRKAFNRARPTKAHYQSCMERDLFARIMPGFSKNACDNVYMTFIKNAKAAGIRCKYDHMTIIYFSIILQKQNIYKRMIIIWSYSGCILDTSLPLMHPIAELYLEL